MKGCVLWLILAAAPVLPHREKQAPSEQRAPDEEAPPIHSILGNLGLDVSTPDGRYSMHLWFRGQFRYSLPFDRAPRSAEGFGSGDRSSLDVRRARLKLGGNAYRSWIRYYLEYDLVTPSLLDLHLTLTRLPWLQLRVGQWKVIYNRERVDSSGRQQFVERSIVNREFTLDRQPGVMLQGRLFAGRAFDSSYVGGLFNGNGINASNDDASMMWVARYQWNVFGRELSFSQSDVEYHEEPAGSLAFATSRNRSPFTRYSTRGGGQLDGFGPGETGRYRLTQLLEETAFKYRGFSFQQELHWKEIEDTSAESVTDLRGAYAQAGYLPWREGDHPLRNLELALRWAWVDPDRSIADDDRRELTLGANWFFSGHDNKLTFDLSRLTLEQPGAEALADSRVRLQWDVSF